MGFDKTTLACCQMQRWLLNFPGTISLPDPLERMGHSDLNLTTNRYMDATQLAVADAIGKLPRLLSTGGTHIGTQISGPEGQNKAQPDAGGFGNPKQKPLKTGAQVALWREETQSKLVEAVGVET